MLVFIGLSPEAVRNPLILSYPPLQEPPSLYIF